MQSKRGSHCKLNYSEEGEINETRRRSGAVQSSKSAHTTLHWPGPSRHHLGLQLSSLSTAGLLKNRLPFDLGLVIGVDIASDLKRLLQVLLSTSVNHAPLLQR